MSDRACTGNDTRNRGLNGRRMGVGEEVGALKFWKRFMVAIRKALPGWELRKWGALKFSFLSGLPVGGGPDTDVWRIGERSPARRAVRGDLPKVFAAKEL